MKHVSGYNRRTAEEQRSAKERRKLALARWLARQGEEHGHDSLTRKCAKYVSAVDKMRQHIQRKKEQHGRQEL